MVGGVAWSEWFAAAADEIESIENISHFNSAIAKKSMAISRMPEIPLNLFSKPSVVAALTASHHLLILNARRQQTFEFALIPIWRHSSPARAVPAKSSARVGRLP
jgi:hypothetical protein